MLSPMRKPYPTDLSDVQWNRLRSYLPIPKPQGRPRTHSLRDVLDAIFYVLKSGCHWRLLPHDFPPWPTVYYHFRKLRLSGVWGLIYQALRGAERNRVGKNADASAALMDSQSVKSTEEGARSNCYDAHKNVKGASATCWWTRWGFRSRCTSPRPTYKTGAGHGVFWPG